MIGEGTFRLTSRSAHVCVDMQRLFAADGPWPTPWMERDVVLATALGAIDHNYSVIVATDAVCSPSDMGHDALITLFTERYTRLMATAEVAAILSAWPR